MTPRAKSGASERCPAGSAPGADGDSPRAVWDIDRSSQVRGTASYACVSNYKNKLRERC
ncbi:hypothetical protein GCM10009834_08140 [Streptomonospora arabica]